MALSELSGKLHIGEDVLEALGVTREQLPGMGLRTFIELAMNRGYDVGVDISKPPAREGRLTIEMTPPRFSPATRI